MSCGNKYVVERLEGWIKRHPTSKWLDTMAAAIDLIQEQDRIIRANNEDWRESEADLWELYRELAETTERAEQVEAKLNELREAVDGQCELIEAGNDAVAALSYENQRLTAQVANQASLIAKLQAEIRRLRAGRPFRSSNRVLPLTIWTPHYPPNWPKSCPRWISTQIRPSKTA
jgi:predicted RNase H-like nuclease (RuvC/YqgF family)